jgi:hypothetical protein
MTEWVMGPRESRGKFSTTTAVPVWRPARSDPQWTIQPTRPAFVFTTPHSISCLETPSERVGRSRSQPARMGDVHCRPTLDLDDEHGRGVDKHERARRLRTS